MTSAAATAAANLWRFGTPLGASASTVCRVVFAGPHFQAALGLTEDLLRRRRLQDAIRVVHAPTDAQLLRSAPTADVALPFMQRLDAAFLSSAPRLRLVQQFGVGLEGVDLAAATAAGVAVSNIPAAQTGNAEATAEHALLLALSLLRQAATELPRRLRERQLGGLPVPRSVFGKRVTVVGYGAVGSKVGEYFAALGARVTAVRRDWSKSSESSSSSSSSNIQRNIQQSTNLREALPTTDLLILACTMTPETRHLLNAETLPLLPPAACVVNVGRGPLVEYHALRRALQDRRLAGFASDVGVGHPDKPPEPWDPDDPLSKHPRALFTPHVGGYTDHSYGLMVERVVDNIERVVRGEPPAPWVNRPQNE